jgi:disulfide bond formation protein DsbB
MARSTAVMLNAIGLYGVALVLIVAYAEQFLLGELPCPLCLLQRFQFAMLAVGPILNVRYGPRPSHYALSLFAAVVGATVSARQILLHILPGDPGFGSALFGYHLYTWAFIGFAAAIVLIAFVLLFDRQFQDGAEPLTAPSALTSGTFASGAVWLVIGLIVANVFTTLAECGFGPCADNPVEYELFKRVR